MKPTIYSEISKGAMLLHEQILACVNVSPEIQSLYKGCQVLFSPLVERPKILLIGNNPGGGYYKWHGKIAEEFEPMEALGYYLNTHSLAEQTKSLFRQAGMEEDLQYHTAKTNFYYWATDKETNTGLSYYIGCAIGMLIVSGISLGRILLRNIVLSSNLFLLNI